VKKHISAVIVALIIVSVLVLYMVTFTVRWKEKALVLTFGKISRQETEPGLKWIWPWQSVVAFDGRIRTLEQQTIETKTRDETNIILTVYVNWRITDPAVFYESFRSGTAQSEDVVFEAEKTIRNWMADTANIFSEYNLGQLVTLDREKFKLPALEKGLPDQPGGMLGRIREKAGTSSGHGIEIVDLGIKRLGVPDSVSENVFNRMKEDREAVVRTLLAQGQAQADSIVADADSKATMTKARAQASAKDIMGKGDAEAARYYDSFLANPQLANYFRKLETLRKTLSERTTIILDSKSPPYELLQSGVNIGGKVEDSQK
jgi:membrane protease subunit HflC